jgi:hypothetical protein
VVGDILSGKLAGRVIDWAGPRRISMLEYFEYLVTLDWLRRVGFFARPELWLAGSCLFDLAMGLLT